MKIFDQYSCNSVVSYGAMLLDNTRCFVGLECEIEAVKNPTSMAGFHVKEDGSLRNNGYEFITDPVPVKTAIDQFAELHKKLDLGEDAFSQRTSTHVHVNVAGLTLQETKNLLLLYALFEECFFLMAKPERRNNIHCTPLSETFVPSSYKTDIPNLVKGWHKYTALNLKRIRDLGTVEFRHLHGTGDVTELKQWLQVLENLFFLSQKVNFAEDSIADEKNIYKWFDELFKDAPRVYVLRNSLPDLTANSLIDVKFAI